LAESYPSVKVDTYNTLACYFRRINYTKEALEYLYKAIEIRPSVDTHLNLCAVLSQAGKHDLALE